MAVKPSPRLALLLLLFHALVAIAVCLTAIPLVARLAMLVPVLLSLFYYLARDALLLLPDSWSEISFDQGRVSVGCRGGSGFSGQLANDTTVSPYFIILCVRPDERRWPVYRPIFPDALDMDEFRELRVRLRFSKKPI